MHRDQSMRGTIGRNGGEIALQNGLSLPLLLLVRVLRLLLPLPLVLLLLIAAVVLLLGLILRRKATKTVMSSAVGSVNRSALVTCCSRELTTPIKNSTTSLRTTTRYVSDADAPQQPATEPSMQLLALTICPAGQRCRPAQTRPARNTDAVPISSNESEQAGARSCRRSHTQKSRRRRMQD